MALEYELKALTIEQETGSKYGIAGNLANIAEIYFIQGNDAKRWNAILRH
jgi:hypothetical protein